MTSKLSSVQSLDPRLDEIKRPSLRHGGGSDPWEFLELSRERWIGTPATSLARSWAEAFVCSQRGPQNVRSVDSVVVRLLRCFASQGFRWYKSTQLGPKPEQLQRVCQWRSWKFCVEETCMYIYVYTYTQQQNLRTPAQLLVEWGVLIEDPDSKT